MFSCFARELKKVSARSVPELQASIMKSFSGVKVTWLRSVVNYWAARASRWNTAVTLMGSYSFEITLRGGRPVMRTKDEMRQEEWTPLGGCQYATPMLNVRVPSPSPTAFSFVVATVHAVAALRSQIASDEERLRLPRSAVRFQQEEAGAAFQWWVSFLDAEEARAAEMCDTCRDIRVELATIVIRQQKSKNEEVKAANRVKSARRNELLEQLETHLCADRAQGKLAVPTNHSRTLSALASAAALPVRLPDSPERKQARGGGMAEEELDEGSASESCDDIPADAESFMPRTVKKQSLPKAFKDRGDLIKKGMVVAVPCAAQEGEDMFGQPFWLAKVTRLSQRHITLWYLGDKFLGLYTPLLNKDDNSKHMFKYPRDAITILHWNIRLTGVHKGGRGYLSAGDQKVLSLDLRVKWQLPEPERKSKSSSSSSSSSASSGASSSASASRKRQASSEPPSAKPAKRGRGRPRKNP